MAAGWFGLAAEPEADDADLMVFGIPYDGSGFFRRGAAQVPEIIRTLSAKLPPATEDGRLLSALSILDLGDIEVDPHLMSFEPLYDRARDNFRRARSRGRPLALGGDHSVSIPLIHAAAEWAGKDIDVLWIHAHPGLEILGATSTARRARTPGWSGQ